MQSGLSTDRPGQHQVYMTDSVSRPPARPPTNRPSNLLVGQKHGSEWLRCSGAARRRTNACPLFLFAFRALGLFRLSVLRGRVGWRRWVREGSLTAVAHQAPLPPLRVQRGGTIDALPLASRLTFVPLTCQRKQGLVCCSELVEFSRKKKGTTKEKNSIPC